MLENQRFFLVQHKLTYNELSRQFQSIFRFQRVQIDGGVDPRFSRTCNSFANLSNSITHITSDWFIIEEHTESDDNETKVHTNVVKLSLK
ncbi:hypothetical protein RhiirA4_484787 [Rhizophagus irregularis]|uniref:Uncharacterized protein n=1 Tax=Rhizophagus irregularis TaxID=588596 RepID=A0A2I1HPD0_9GLOM|nr:hypothetical protein RhiirA4_484787 [Rhizophagus irregularis]